MRIFGFDMIILLAGKKGSCHTIFQILLIVCIIFLSHFDEMEDQLVGYNKWEPNSHGYCNLKRSAVWLSPSSDQEPRISIRIMDYSENGTKSNQHNLLQIRRNCEGFENDLFFGLIHFSQIQTVATPPETPPQITPKPDNNNINNGQEEEKLVKEKAAKPSEAPKEEHLDNKKDESPRKKPKKSSREKIHKNPGAGNDGKKNDGENQEREKEEKEKTKSVKKSTRNDAKSAETLVTPQGDADMDKDGETKTKKTEEQDEKEGGGGKTEMSDAKKEMLKEDDTLRETKSIGKKKKKQEKT
ncbi:Protein CBG18507 [Caenorhabditis briggsae]|uniref:Protein CBG18507 n=1 Tax=Caenorhabditis briggsae TaxID=6238 RepID=A8XTG5_CAEBR|nr:Protein CBG18507 [Caenorhabditis briggsae]CAP35942.2 Protein CBG18507 [Caenorhabditis briggsae]